jgi:hypothetical protein
MDIFSFDEQVFDFWPIYDSIKRYYPIGIPFNEHSYKFYRSYPGIVELNRLVLDNVHINKNYRERWTKFKKQLKKDFGREVEGTTYGQVPSYSAFIRIARKKVKDILASKELHFAVSFVGPYYTIYGLDSCAVLLSGDDNDGRKRNQAGYYDATNVITTSPHQEYADTFLRLEIKIKERYPGYNMIPYSTNCQFIRGLQVDYMDKQDCTIFNALFHDTHKIHEIRYRGDDYGYEEWRKKHHS